MKLHTAAGGFAAEHLLFITNKIIITEKAFFEEAIKNSVDDRRKVCYDKNISEEECLELFKDYALNLSNDLQQIIDKMEKINWQ